MSRRSEILDKWRRITEFIVENRKSRVDAEKPETKTSDLKLIEVWKQRCQLYSKAMRLFGEGSRLLAEAEKSEQFEHVSDEEIDALRERGAELSEQSRILFNQGYGLWHSAVITEYGCVELKWRERVGKHDSDCILPNGDEYTVEMGQE